MEWDADKLTRFMKHFGVNANQISIVTGIAPSTVYNLKSGSYNFGKYNQTLTAYLMALKQAKKVEFEAMIKYFESFNP